MSMAWVRGDPHRTRLVRWLGYFGIGWLLELGLATALGRLGLVAQLLSGASLLAALAGLVLLTVRVLRIVVLPPAIAYALTRVALAAIGARGDDPARAGADASITPR